ncbi:hypothetical protein CVS40_7042 [Lucilia cuprina]|nr:hypothetical protein CVS40_7042 [Lucilia cuprina]
MRLSFHDNGLAMNLRLCSASSSPTSSLTPWPQLALGRGVPQHQSSSSAAAEAALAAAAGAGAQQRSLRIVATAAIRSRTLLNGNIIMGFLLQQPFLSPLHSSKANTPSKQEKRRELRLKRFWRSPKTTSSEDSTGYESPTRAKVTNDAQRFNHLHYTSLAQSAPSHEADSEGGGVSKVKTSIVGGGNNLNNKPTCSLPLLQVWPSQPLLRQEGFIQLRRNSGPEGQRYLELDEDEFTLISQARLRPIIYFPCIAETSTSSSSGGGNSTSTSVGTTLTTSTSGNSSNSTSGKHLTLNTER